MFLICSTVIAITLAFRCALASTARALFEQPLKAGRVQQTKNAADVPESQVPDFVGLLHRVELRNHDTQVTVAWKAQ
jgi:hypothetical protein